jgi:hypothetical protein
MIMQPTVFYGCCSNTLCSYFVHMMYVHSTCFSDDIDIKGFFYWILDAYHLVEFMETANMSVTSCV